jgi:hypothetical protein
LKIPMIMIAPSLLTGLPARESSPHAFVIGRPSGAKLQFFPSQILPLLCPVPDEEDDGPPSDKALSCHRQIETARRSESADFGGIAEAVIERAAGICGRQGETPGARETT